MSSSMKEALEVYKRLWAIRYASGLLSWDLETYMPKSAAADRGEVFGQLSVISQDLTLRLSPLVERLEKEVNDDVSRGNLRVIRRDLAFYTKVPPSLLQDISKVTSEATVTWRDARQKSDFKKFLPYLNRIVELNKELAEKLGYEGSPYNALLDLYEEGVRTDDIDAVFSYLIPNSKRILEKTRAPSSSRFETMEYSPSDLEKVNREVLQMIGMPWDRFRIDVSTHPFTVGLSVNDVRITTRYEGKDFKQTIFSTIHESGHAIYELGLDPSLQGQPVGTAVSSGIHESQSRFWENIIGRSRQMTEKIYEILRKHLTFVGDSSPSEIYDYFNIVRPSLIRVDADELTYNFHIFVRYTLEKQLIEGKIDASDVPSMWDDLIEKNLGVRPKNDTEGCLQDIHWSNGSFGYFPTYTLGNVVAGTLWASAPWLYDSVAEADFHRIKTYLGEKIHRLGSIYPPKELLRRSFGKEYYPRDLVRYLEQKYL